MRTGALVSPLPALPHSPCAFCVVRTRRPPVMIPFAPLSSLSLSQLPGIGTELVLQWLQTSIKQRVSGVEYWSVLLLIFHCSQLMNSSA